MGHIAETVMAGIRLGDRVSIGGGIDGVVVCSIDTDKYSADYPKDKWAYLERGIMVDTERIGLVHLEEPDEDIEVIEGSAAGG